MGNDIKLIGGRVGHIIQQFDTPQGLTSRGVPVDVHQNSEDCKQLNQLLAKHVINLGSKLELDPHSIVKNAVRWDRSTVRGVISIERLHGHHHEKEKSQIKERSESQTKVEQKPEIIKEITEAQKKSESSIKEDKLQPKQANGHPRTKTYNIILTLHQVYELKNLLSSYTQEQTQIEQKRKSVEGELCVICLDNKPEEVLPCAHEYCKKCVQIYILEKDRKCPMCRKSYKESLSSDTYQIVQWDSEFVAEMRNIFYKILEANNEREVQKIKRILQSNEKEAQN